VVHKRVQVIKLKETKEQHLMYYAATSGMNEIKFPEAPNPKSYWQIAEQVAGKRVSTKAPPKYADEKELQRMADFVRGLNNG